MLKHLSAAALAMSAFLPLGAEAGQLWLSMDRTQRYQLDDPAGRVVVTNPAVADVQVLSSTEMLFFPRMPGHTDILFFSPEGERQKSLRVRVGKDAGGTLTLQNGAERYTFVCTSRCEQSPAYGDGELQTPQALMAQAQALEAAGNAAGRLREEKVRVNAPDRRQDPGS